MTREQLLQAVNNAAHKEFALAEHKGKEPTNDATVADVAKHTYAGRLLLSIADKAVAR
jgi:hypothetical protein